MTSAYNTAFPALYSTSTFMQPRQNTVQKDDLSLPLSHSPTSLPARSSAPPKFPSYLKQTLYGKLVLEQYQYHQHKQETKLTHSEKEQFEKLDLRLPTFWNMKDKSRNIQIGINGLDLSYIGPGKQETHAALARSNFPMRPQCGLFYFEMRVISKGDDGYIGIGFCAATNKLERLPGWDPDSWGYHGDDGHSFEGSGTGKNYGPCFTTGDVIGCGVNFADNSAFYTKNGKFLGYAFTNMDFKKDIYPAIGLRTPGEQVTANFGHEPFVFDIDQYLRDQQLRWVGDITSNCLHSFSKPTMDQLVLSYLIHHGYTSTAKALVQNTDHLLGEQPFLLPSNTTCLPSSTEERGDRQQQQEQQQKDMEERQLIRSAIIHGRIDEAIRLINLYFPGVLQEEGRGQELQLWLKCGKFVEMMRSYCELQNKMREDSMLPLSSSSSSNTSNSLSSATGATIHNKRKMSYSDMANSSDPSSKDTVMVEADQEDETKLKDGVNIWGKRPNISMESSNDPLDPDESFQEATAQHLKDIMHYGQTLQDEYKHDTREKTKASLVEIFSLLAYPDPYCSPVAYLMNASRRDGLATEVNAAILGNPNI
ncbi:concanavalin A-like lectin/glucanase domain-containing protein [Blakeslea trispora]|nr:concanavalin A-like lectin/glucanase domain-containing protein [Blakeslea trispora]